MTKKLIVLDTETTGLEVDQGHRIIEIGAVLLEDRKRTDQHFHTYLNPQRAIDEEAQKVHGISNEKVKNEHADSDETKDDHHQIWHHFYLRTQRGAKLADQ